MNVPLPSTFKLNLILEPVLLVGALEGSFLASFGLGWGVTVGAGLASYPLDTIRYVLCGFWLCQSLIWYLLVVA